jgi:cyclopropane fatty-acyl-phospholipid synthase-like methyltransferase
MTLINADYKRQLQEMHLNPKKFANGTKKLKTVRPFLEKYKPQSIIDFGCSHGGLITAIQENFSMEATGYDPGVPRYEILPTTPFDCLVSTDVLEHIEPGMIDDTLKTINNMFTKSAFLLIASYPAKKHLPDGRNAHLIIESFDWWKIKLETFIDGKIVRADTTPVTLTPKKGPAISGYEYIFVIEK